MAKSVRLRYDNTYDDTTLMTTLRFGRSIFKDFIVLAIISISLTPILVDCLSPEASLPIWGIFIAPAILSALFLFRIREYNDIELSHDAISAKNRFWGRINCRIKFSDIRYVEASVPMGRNEEPNLTVHTASNERFTIYLRLLSSSDIIELLAHVEAKGVNIERERINRYLGISKQIRPLGNRVAISKLNDYSSIKTYRATISQITRILIITFAVLDIIIIATCIYFNDFNAVPFVFTTVASLVIIALHRQEQYIAISNERLFTVRIAGDRTSSIHSLSDVDAVHFSKQIDGYLQVSIIKGSQINRQTPLSLTKREALIVAKALKPHNIEVLYYDSPKFFSLKSSQCH